MGPSGFVALLAGWFVTETGRQPYTVYGLLRTAEFRLADRLARRRALAASPSSSSISIVFGMGVWYLLRLMRADPGGGRAPSPMPHGTTARRRHHARCRRRTGRCRRPMSAMTDLAIIWSAILAFAIYAYVVLDGFDLGIGILAPFARSDDEEETMISAIAPVWDGNETWLVLGGGGLMAAFPLAYSILLPALYAPLIAMLLALIFRGVAFEFRHRHERHRPHLDLGLRARLLRRDLRAGDRARHLRPGHRRSRAAPMPAAGSTG